MTLDLTNPEIQKLVNQWIADPCWDIEETEGFEEHREALLAFRLQKEAEWKAVREETQNRNPRTRALKVVCLLKHARLAYAEAVVNLAIAERELKLRTAEAEARVIEAAGGSKNLGSNEADRSRGLLIGIQTDDEYQAAVGSLWLGEDTKAEAWAEMEALRDELKVLLAFAGEPK